jgi:hypothetical protein
MSRRWSTLLAAGLLILSLGLPWFPPRGQRLPGSGPTCIADLSGGGAMICDFIGTPAIDTRVPGGSGADSPARFFLVLALVLLVWGLWSRSTTPLGLSAACALVGVAIALPHLMSGQVATLLAAGLLLATVGAGQRVRSLRSATWGDTAGSSPSPSAR